MSYIRNFLASPTKRNGKEAELLKTSFYFFGLKAGCRIIALFEYLIGLLQLYWTHQEVRGAVRTSTTEFPGQLVTRAPEGELFESDKGALANLYFSNTLNALTILNSLILIVGTELGSICCLLLWLAITVLSKTINTIDTLMEIVHDDDLQTMFYLTISLLMKMYFCTVVASFILKLQNKLRANVSETEVLYTQCEES